MFSKNFEKEADEEVLVRTNFHPSMFYGGFLWLIYVVAITLYGGHDVLATIMIAIGLIWTIWGFVKWTYTEYIITNKRLAIVSGYFYRRILAIPIDKIDNVTIYQNWTDKYWNKGIVTLFGIGIKTKRIRGLANAKTFRDAINSQLAVEPDHYFD